MFDDTLHIPLRFYDAVEKQDRFKDHATTKRFHQYTDATHLPEFQINVASGVSSSTINIVSLAGTSATITPTVYYVPFSAFTYLIYDRTSTVNLSVGDYYLDITAGSDHFYSEVFTVADITDKTILTYYNTYDLGGIDYTNGTEAQYKNTLIIDAILAKPEYIIEEEAVEDGEGNQLITFQRSVKLFKMWFYAPEYIVDAVALIGLHDFVSIWVHYGTSEQETGSIYDFTMTAEWMESKGLAKVTCEFRDTPIIKTTCSDPIV